MFCRGILIPGIALMTIAVMTSGSSCSSIYFDADGDSLPDTEYDMSFGDEVVLSVRLAGFLGQTGSFQFEIFYDNTVLRLDDYDTYVGQPDEDSGLSGLIQTKAELGPWGTSQWSSPVTQEVNELDTGSGLMREFYTAGSLTETATGDGVLAYLVFKAVGGGQTDLDLQMPGDTWFLEGVSAQPEPIRITIHSIPEPSMPAFFVAAIAFLLAKYRKRVQARLTPW